VYLNDFVRTLLSFGIRGLGSSNFVKKVEAFFEKQVPFLNAKMIENLLFFLSRVGSENHSILIDLISSIEKNDYLAKGEVKDVIMLMAVMNQYKIDNKNLWS